MAERTSSTVAGEKLDRIKGGEGGSEWGSMVAVGEKDEESLEILSPKK